MLDNTFHPSDNIFLGLSTLQVIDPTVNITETVIGNSTIFELNSRGKYPILEDCGDSLNLLDYNTGTLEIPVNTEDIISIPLYNDFLKEHCELSCSPVFQQKLNDYSFRIKSPSHPDSGSIFLMGYDNPVTGNIIYDYVKNENGSTTYNGSIQDIVRKYEVVGFGDLPEYTLKCIDSTGAVSYKSIELIDLGWSNGTGVITTTFYDKIIHSSSSPIYVSLNKFPIILQCDFQVDFFKELRDNYSYVMLEIKIKATTEPLTITNNDLWFNWYMGKTFKFSLDLDKVDLLFNGRAQFLNRGLYFNYTSNDIQSIHNPSDANVSIAINDVKFKLVEPDFSKSLFVSMNYMLGQSGDINYTPFPLHSSFDQNILTITIKDLVNDEVYKLEDDITLTLMRSMVEKNTNYYYYNTNKSSICINDFQYQYAKERFEFNDMQIKQNCYVYTNKFEQDNIGAIGIHLNDISQILNSLDDSLVVDVYWHKINEQQSLLYLRLSEENSNGNYLRRFINTNVVDFIAKNIVISMNVNGEDNRIKQLLYSDLSEPINRFTLDNKINYVYNMSGYNIIGLNGVYNKSELKLNSKINKDNYYVPNDVILIEGNTRNSLAHKQQLK